MAYTSKDILDWFIANPNADAALINKTITDSKVTKQQIAEALAGKPAIAQKYLTAQILSQGTTGKWKGTGLGSAEANAADMAKIMADVGITDISQFGKVKTKVNSIVQPVYSNTNEGSTITGYVDAKGNPVDARLVKSDVQYSGGDAGTAEMVYTAPVDQETFGNKLTGQAVANTYGERQTESAFGGTYSGKGNTAYRVQFDATGNPVFYTTEASSSDASDWMPIVQLALAATGAGGLLGNSLLGAGANQIAANALGGALLGGATTGIAGGDILKGALLGGGGGALSGYLQGGGPIDAANMTATQLNDALETQLITEMQRSGLTNAQITQFLENASPTNIASITSALPVTTSPDNVVVTAPTTQAPVNIGNVFATTPTLTVTGKAPTTPTTQQDVINAITAVNSNLAGTPTATPELVVKDERPVTPVVTIPPIIANTPVIAAVPPVVPPAKTPVTPPPTTPPTIGDVVKTIGTVATVASLVNAVNPPTVTPPTTGFDIIPIPPEWKTPPPTGVAPYTPLPPIDFGTRNLLKGTQWEELLDPNYGKVPAPVRYSQPSNLSYNDLMSILGSKQGMPPASSLSINDIISGIQNQYGQAPTRTMG
jgi:hypothetical protein